MGIFEPIGPYELNIISKKHAREVYKAIDKNKDYLSEYIDFFGDLDYDSIKGSIKMWQKEQILGKGLMIGLFDGKKVVGMISLKIDATDSLAEVGYWLDEDYTGRGLMTKSIREILKMAFGLYKLNKVYIKCVDSNKKSIAVGKRLGFSYEGRLRDHQRLNGEYRDLLVFSILKREWDQYEGN